MKASPLPCVMMIANAMQAQAAATSRGEDCVTTSSSVLSRMYHCVNRSPAMQTTVSSIFTVGSTASACACRPAIAASMVTAARPALAVATQRYIEVVTQPGGERDVPPPPEIREAYGGIRKTEVVGNAEAEALSSADRDYRISCEVAKDLSGKRQGAKPCIQCA